MFFILENIWNFVTENYESIFQCLQIVGSIILSIVLFVKTKDLKYLKEVEKLIKYRTPNYKDTEVIKGQTFETLKPVYRLNPATNELEKTDEVIDIQEIINSCRETCLQTVLERFFPTETTENVVQETYSNMLDDLDYFREMSNVAEEYKVKLGLDTKLSIQEVFNKVNEKADEMRIQLAKLNELQPKNLAEHKKITDELLKEKEFLINEKKKNEQESK